MGFLGGIGIGNLGLRGHEPVHIEALDHDLHDREYTDAYLSGVDELREALAPFTLEYAAKRCHVEAKDIAGQIGGKVVMIEGAGHYPQTEMPEEVTPVVLDFLRRRHQPA